MNKCKWIKTLLKGGLVVFIFLAFSMTLSAGGNKEGSAVTADMDIMEALEVQGKVLHIYDWAEWWPEEIYEGFSKEYGIEIVRDNFASVDDMVTKIKLNPGADYDITLPEIRNFVIMKELGLLQEMNHDWLPNAEKYLPETTKNAWYDPGYKYSVATDNYLLAPLYNTKYVDVNDPDFGSWKWFFESAPKYSKKITMLETMFQVIGAALISRGYSYNSDVESELMEAKEVLEKFKPHLMSYDEWPKRVLLEEEAWISQLWIGESWFLHLENDAIRGVLPPEGTLKGVDSLVIPIGSKHSAAAHLFIDYVLRPDINALLISNIGYATNHTETGKYLPEEMKDWPGVNPSAEYLAKSEFVNIKAYTGKGLELREKIWDGLRQ